MTNQRILIAGIGNIFLGDDAFGVHVAQELLQRPLPDHVQVVDFGIRGFDLAYAILDEPDVTIMVDAVPKGAAPGTLYVIEVESDDVNALEGQALETHAMHPIQVLRLVGAFGGRPKRLLVVGCEPATLGPEEGQMGLSEPVQAAVAQAVTLIESLVERILDESRSANSVALQ